MKPLVRKLIPCILLALSVPCMKAQFFAWRNDSSSYHTLLSSKVDTNLRVVSLENYQGQARRTKGSKILIYSTQKVLIDSVVLPPFFVPSKSEPLKVGNKYYWSGSRTKTFDSQPYLCVLELDSLFNALSEKRLCDLPSSWNERYRDMPTDIVKLFNYYYVGWRNNDDSLGKITTYKLNGSLSKVDSSSFNTYYETITDTKLMSDSVSLIYLGSRLPPCTPTPTNNMYIGIGVTLLKMDTNFTVLNCKEIRKGYTNFNLFNQLQTIDPFWYYSNSLIISRTRILFAGTNHLTIPGKKPTDIPFFNHMVVHLFFNQNLQPIETKYIYDTTQYVSYYWGANYLAHQNNQIASVFLKSRNLLSFYELVPNHLVINMMDTLGNPIWQKSFYDGYFYKPSSVVFTKDGGLLVAGFRHDTVNTFSFKLFHENFLIKLGKNGDVQWTAINENGHLRDFEVRLFPNPSSDVLTIDYPFQNNLTLMLFDNLGRVVVHRTNLPTGSTIDVRQLPSGIYYYTVESKSKVNSGKIIVQH